MKKSIIPILFLICLSIKINAIDITITNFLEFPDDCGSVDITVNVQDAALNETNPTVIGTGDVVTLMVRDGNCNIIGFSGVVLLNGEQVITLPLDFPCLEENYCPPTAFPFLYSFHDDGDVVRDNVIDDIPPVAFMEYTPSSNYCTSLPTITEPGCSFASQPVPALGTWALIICCISIMIVGLIFLAPHFSTKTEVEY